MSYIITILLLVITSLLGVVTFFLKKHFDKVDEISGDVRSIKATLTEFKIELIVQEKRLEIVEKSWKHELRKTK
jgi:hypothetical protein